MSSPAVIAGIVVAAVIGTPLLVAALIAAGYFLHKYFRRHRSLLPHFSLPSKSRIHDNGPAPPEDTASRLDFDNEAFLNAISSSREVEVDPDQHSQSPTQNTFLSYLSREYPNKPPLSPAHSEGGPDQKLKATAIRTDPYIEQQAMKVTRRLSAQSPIQELDDLEYDFSNPAFEQSDNFLRFTSAALRLQSWWRGCLVRRQLPQMRLEKLNRDRLAMPRGAKPTASLANMRFFDVRGYGYIEVEQLYGLEVVRSAVKKLKKKYGTKGRVKMKIIVTPKGVKLFDTSTKEHVATVKIEGISFCSLDPNNRKIFAFINRKKGRNFCHVFQCNEEDSQELVEVCAEAFDRVIRMYDEKRPVSKRSEVLTEEPEAT